MPQFELATYPSQVFWLLVCFISLSLIMVLHLVPRLMNGLRERERYVDENLQEIENIKTQLSILKVENLKQLEHTKKETHALIHNAIEEANRIKIDRLEILEKNRPEIMQKIQTHLDKDKKLICHDMELIVSQVILRLLPSIIGHSFTKSQIEVMTKNSLKKINLQSFQENF